ncbi:MAG: dihydrofolate reductase family protein [Acidimicrobiales bacterium]
MARKLVAYELLSLDGVAEDPDQFITDWDDVMDENLARVIATQDTVILGRRTYNDWAAFWPTSEIEPFATFINGVDKYVVTSTTPDDLWAKTSVIGADYVEHIADLKQRPGGDIGLHGSIDLTGTLLAGGLVDELRLVVAPQLQGAGRRLFDSGVQNRLTLTRSVESPAGYLLLDYAVSG